MNFEYKEAHTNLSDIVESSVNWFGTTPTKISIDSIKEITL